VDFVRLRAPLWMQNCMLTRAQILEALQDVKDPEIPAVSIVEMGLVAEVQTAPGRVRVALTPTFAGCPAVEVMRAASEQRIRELGVENVSVQITFDPPWNSDRISPEGRRKLREFGLAPPRLHGSAPDLVQLLIVECPYCGSADTKLESAFGPTLCRAIHYCNHCRQSFEQFKPL
jgi:ring-1,2-phenylacetyl-CoA epoxidase subunit PaaD